MRPALLADVFEAFIGALYIDQGMDAVTKFLETIVVPKIRNRCFFACDGLQKSIARNYSTDE